MSNGMGVSDAVINDIPDRITLKGVLEIHYLYATILRTGDKLGNRR